MLHIRQVAKAIEKDRADSNIISYKAKIDSMLLFDIIVIPINVVMSKLEHEIAKKN